MATYTPNLNLGKPEATDAFGNFRQLFNDNMDILDNGGGGGSGGHTIVNPSGTDMPAESKLQFTGAVTVTDDSANNKTVVNITGGGGGSVHYSTSEQVIGTFFGKPLYQKSWDLVSGILISYNAWTDTSIDSTNMENIVSAKATHPDGTCYEGIMADPTRQNHTLVGLQTTRNGNDARARYVTLQYTKVTD